MNNQYLHKILLSQFLDNDLKRLLVTVVENIFIEKNIIKDIYDIAKKYGNNFLLVADKNTIELLDSSLLRQINCYIVPSQCGFYFASEAIVNEIIKKSHNIDLLIACGSGTINDLCKYASYLTNKSYIVFPTAASMNGYISANASITMNDGHKKSLKATLPKAVYIDPYVIINAPIRLTNSGFADFMCRSTAQTDWLISHLILGTEYNETPFFLVREIEQELIQEYLGLKSRDEKTIMLLMQALLLSGLGMFVAGGSFPASQGEHMIAAGMDLVDYNNRWLHGEKIAVTTITMSCLQQKILRSNNKIKPTSLNKNDIWQCFGEKYFDEFSKILDNKKIDQKKADVLNFSINQKYNDLIEKMNYVVNPVHSLQNMLENLGAPCCIKDLSWDFLQYKLVANLAFTTRERFTFLDLAHHMGISVVD